MVFSASYPDGLRNMKGDAYYFLRKQVQFGVLGIIAMIIVMNMPVRLFKTLSPIVFVLTLGLQLLLFTPLGLDLNGQVRWLKIGSFTMMPAEFTKVAAIMMLANYLSIERNDIRTGVGKVIGAAIVAGIPTLLIMKTDFSNSFVLAATLGIMLFVAGLKWAYVGVGIAGVAGVMVKVISATGENGFRKYRWMAFLDPFAYKDSFGYQIIQSLYAYAYGGVFGAGLGKSIQKYYYLPEPYNDFISAIIGEELGLVGCLFVLTLFVIIFWRGIKIALGCQEKFDCYLAVGCMSLLVVQGFIHMGVTVSLLPTTGLPMPFVSAGGTSLLAFFGSMGMLLSISRKSEMD